MIFFRTFAAPFRHMFGTLPALLSRSGSKIMAVLLNIISSGSRKSAGAATFRRVRGRTIMSQKRGGLSKSALETRAATGLVRTYREAMFYIVTSFCAGMADTINASFEPTKYGTSRNAFFKLNYSAIEKAVNGTAIGLALLDQLMHQATFSGVEITPQGGSTFGIYTFNIEDFDVLMGSMPGGAAGSVSIVRATRGGYIRYSAPAQNWGDFTDPVIPTNISFEVSVNAATAEGQQITEILVSATNWPATPKYEVRVSGTVLAGTWTGYKFIPTASPRYPNPGTVAIYNADGEIIAKRIVQFSRNNEAGGE